MRRRFVGSAALVLVTLIAQVVLTTLTAPPARAQLGGENLLGDTGVRNATQAEPGLYLGGLYYLYNTDVIRNRNGDQVTIDPTQSGSQRIQAMCPLLLYVSRAKVFGASYGVMAVMPFANASLEASGLGFGEDVSTAAGDLYLVPLQLGWHLSRADVMASFALFAPTGRYEAGGSDNIGKGMWSYELSTGSTYFFDEKKTLSLAASAFWEIHSKKQDSGNVQVGNITLSDVKVGQILTLEGGLGKSFLKGAASVGLAYYGQWKLTSDDFGIAVTPPGGPVIGKHRVWGLGPDVTIPVATNSKLISLVNVRYFWETGARVKTEGQSLVVTATFPVPSIKITRE